MSDWRQELIDFINAKAKEHADMPMNKLGYFRLMEQLARHQANHVAAKLQSEYRTYSPDNQPVDYLINPTLAEEKDFCVECGVEVFDGGSWGYCDPCYEKLPKNNEDRRAALQHWEKCFRDGTVEDEHAEFIAEVLAKAKEELEP